MDERSKRGRELLRVKPLLAQKSNEQFLLGLPRSNYGLIAARRLLIGYLCVGGFLGYFFFDYLVAHQAYFLIILYWILFAVPIGFLIKRINSDRQLFANGVLIVGKILKITIVTLEDGDFMQLIYEFVTPSGKKIADGKSINVAKSNWIQVDQSESNGEQSNTEPKQVIILYHTDNLYELL